MPFVKMQTLSNTGIPSIFFLLLSNEKEIGIFESLLYLKESNAVNTVV